MVAGQKMAVCFFCLQKVSHIRPLATGHSLQHADGHSLPHADGNIVELRDGGIASLTDFPMKRREQSDAPRSRGASSAASPFVYSPPPSFASLWCRFLREVDGERIVAAVVDMHTLAILAVHCADKAKVSSAAWQGWGQRRWRQAAGSTCTRQPVLASRTHLLDPPLPHHTLSSARRPTSSSTCTSPATWRLAST